MGNEEPRLRLIALLQTREEDSILESLAQECLYSLKLRPTMHIADFMYHSDIEKDTILCG